MLSTGTTPRQAGWGQLTGFLPWLVSPQWLQGLLPLSCCFWWGCTCGWGGNLVAAFIGGILWVLSSIFVGLLVKWFCSCFSCCSWKNHLFSILVQGASKFPCCSYLFQYSISRFLRVQMFGAGTKCRCASCSQLPEDCTLVTKWEHLTFSQLIVTFYTIFTLHSLFPKRLIWQNHFTKSQILQPQPGGAEVSMQGHCFCMLRFPHFIL